MAGKPKREGFNDLVPGISATAAFLLLLLLLRTENMPTLLLLLLSSILAGAVYFGVRLVLPAAKQEDVKIETAGQVASSIAAMANQLPSDSLQRRVGNILRTTQGLLKYGDAHPEKSFEIVSVMQDYLKLTRTGVLRYLDTARTVPASAQRSEQNLADLLDSVGGTFDSLHKRLVEEESADLSGELHALNQTLKELDSVYLHLGAGEKKD